MTITLYGIPNCDTVKKARACRAERRGGWNDRKQSSRAGYSHELAHYALLGWAGRTKRERRQARRTAKGWLTSRLPKLNQ